MFFVPFSCSNPSFPLPFSPPCSGYDVKWQDLVSSLETVKVTSSPSALASIADLGLIDDVGPKLAKKRNAKVNGMNVRYERREEEKTVGSFFVCFSFFR